MIPIDQTILHAPDEGRYGNCMQATVASLLGVPLEAVPHFLHDNCDSDTFHLRLSEFLRPFNLAFISIAATDGFYAGIHVSGLHHEVAGLSDRGFVHACAGVDGELVHDPHPSKTGLTRIETHGLFVVLDPSKPIGRPA